VDLNIQGCLTQASFAILSMAELNWVAARIWVFLKGGEYRNGRAGVSSRFWRGSAKGGIMLRQLIRFLASGSCCVPEIH
jgi:hypothetical protein